MRKSKAALLLLLCAVTFPGRAQSNFTFTAPIHEYKFTDPAGTNFADSIGGAAWTGSLPAGGFLTGGQLTLNPAANQYGRLPAGVVGGLTDFSITTWVNLSSTANWARIFDFGNNTTSYMFLAPKNGSTGVLRFAITTSGPGGEQQLDGLSVLAPGAWHYVAVTLSGATGRLYVDGLPVRTNASMTLNPSSLGATLNNYLGKSQWADPYLDGAFANFSVYNVALSADEVAAAYSLGSGIVRPRMAFIDTSKTYQTIEGFGGAMAFYAGWVTALPNNYKLEIYTNAFAGLNLSMLRLGDWYRYQTPLAGFDSAATEIVANANRVLGHPVQVYMSSWAPPAFLKSNGQVGNGGTLITNSDGSYAYTQFGQYWYDSLQAYQFNGVTMKWISIQNEPDWAAGYDSCVLHPTEDTVNGTNYASYSKALDAVYQKLATLPSPPQLLAPEPTHIAYNDLQNYASRLNTNSFYGVAYHLYGGSTDGTPDGYAGDLTTSANIFPAKPHFMTEFGYPDMLQTACLMHDCLVIGQDSGFNYWSLTWPAGGNALINHENPFASQSTWTNAPPGTPTQSHGWWLTPAYWAMKHFSYFVQPGFKRVSAVGADSNVRCSAYLSPDGLRLVVVLINTNSTASSALDFNFGAFQPGKSAVYQTAGTNTYAGTNTFLSLGSLTNGQLLPPQSITTVVLDQIVSVGSASNPSPATGATALPVNSPLAWTPGNSALSHAVYLGSTSNSVALATPASQQFLGFVTNPITFPRLFAASTNYWRVDEIAGINTNTGPVWSFTTAPAPILLHHYSFSETGGTNLVDSSGGPAWSGMLPIGGSLAGGHLSLASASSQFAQLPAGLVHTLSNFTIIAWVNVASRSNWARILDFGNNTTNYMYLAPQNGANGRLRFAITTSSSGGEQIIDAPTSLPTGTWSQVAVTLRGSMGILYVNGAAVGTNSGLSLYPSILGSTSNNYFGKSQWPDPCLNASLDELRIYTTALSGADVAATYALGPDQLLSPNNPTVVPAVSGTNLALSWPLETGGYLLQTTTNLASGNWTTITSLAPQIVGTNFQFLLPETNPMQFFRLSK